MTQPAGATIATMTITEQDVQQLVHAIQVIYNGASTNADRQQAQLYCDSWKEDSRCPIMGHRLIAPTYPDQIRYFGLGLLESCIRFNWSRYAAEDRAQIRDLLVAVVSQLPADSARFIQEKAANVFTELMERIWPHEWNGLYLLLITLSNSRPVTVCRVLKAIAQDTFVYSNPLTQFRKEDLRNAMIALMAPSSYAQQQKDQQHTSADRSGVPEQYFELCGIPANDIGWLARLISALQQSISTGNELLAVSSIDAIAAYVDWLPLEVLSGNGVLTALVPLLSSASNSVRMIACETLIAIVNRNYAEQSHADGFLLDTLLNDDAIGEISQAWMNAGGNLTAAPEDPESHVDNDYPFLKRLAQLWVDFSTHICHKKRETIPKNFDKYMEFGLVLSRHQSLYINTLTTSLWQNVLKHEYLGKLLDTEACSKVLFEVCASRLNKKSVVPSDEDSATLGSRYSFADFEDSFADFQVAAGSYRSQLYTIFKMIVPRHTAFCLNVCHMSVRQIVDLPVPQVGDATQRSRDTGLLLPTCSYFLEWEAASSLIHATMAALPAFVLKAPAKTDQELVAYTQSMTMIREMLQLVLAFTIDDPLIIAKQLDALTGFAEVLASEPNDQAFQLLQKVFAVVTFTLPTESKVVDANWIVSEDTIALRRKASSSLLRLAVGIPNILMSIYADIEREVARLVSSQLIASEDKSFMVEFLVAIVHNSTSISSQEKQARYEILFEPMVTEILSESVGSKLTSAESFMDAIGLTKLASFVESSRAAGMSADTQLRLSDEARTQLAQCRANRQQIMQMIVTYRSCLTRTVRAVGGSGDEETRRALISLSPWAVNVWRVLPTVFTMIQYMHSLWESKWWIRDSTNPRSLPAELNSVLDMSPLERSVILGSSTTEAAEAEHERVRGPPNTVEQHIHHIRNWLRIFREALYGILNQSSYLVPGEFFYTSQLAPAILNYVFGSVTSLNNNHWRSIVVFLRPLILNCPSEHFSDFVGQIMPPLTTFLGNKLSAEWKQMVDGGLIMGTLEEAESAGQAIADTAHAQDEILGQKILRDVTRGWTDILGQIFMPTLPELRKDKKKSTGVVGRALPDFGIYNDLAMFLLSTNETVEPLLYTMMYSMTWKDTKTCTQMARILDRLMPLMVQDAKFHPFFGREVLSASLQALHDGYHQEGHDQLIGLITDLYIVIRPHTTIPAETLASMVPALATTDAVTSFEARLSRESQPASQRKVVKEALKDIAGVKPGQWFRKAAAEDDVGGGMKKIPDRLLLKKRMGVPGWHEAIDGAGSNAVDLGLMELFQQRR